MGSRTEFASRTAPIGRASSAAPAGPEPLGCGGRFPVGKKKRRATKGILAWAIGIPIPTIMILNLLDVL